MSDMPITPKQFILITETEEAGMPTIDQLLAEPGEYFPTPNGGQACYDEVPNRFVLFPAEPDGHDDYEEFLVGNDEDCVDTRQQLAAYQQLVDAASGEPEEVDADTLKAAETAYDKVRQAAAGKPSSSIPPARLTSRDFRHARVSEL